MVCYHNHHTNVIIVIVDKIIIIATYYYRSFVLDATRSLALPMKLHTTKFSLTALLAVLLIFEIQELLIFEAQSLIISVIKV